MFFRTELGVNALGFGGGGTELAAVNAPTYPTRGHSLNTAGRNQSDNDQSSLARKRVIFTVIILICFSFFLYGVSHINGRRVPVTPGLADASSGGGLLEASSTEAATPVAPVLTKPMSTSSVSPHSAPSAAPEPTEKDIHFSTPSATLASLVDAAFGTNLTSHAPAPAAAAEDEENETHVSTTDVDAHSDTSSTPGLAPAPTPAPAAREETEPFAPGEDPAPAAPAAAAANSATAPESGDGLLVPLSHHGGAMLPSPLQLRAAEVAAERAAVRAKEQAAAAALLEAAAAAPPPASGSVWHLTDVHVEPYFNGILDSGRRLCRAQGSAADAEEDAPQCAALAARNAAPSTAGAHPAGGGAHGTPLPHPLFSFAGNTSLPAATALGPEHSLGLPGCDAPLAGFQALLHRVRAVDPSPALIILSGDLVAHSIPCPPIRSAVQRQVAAELRAAFPDAPVVFAPGNHDYSPPDRPAPAEHARMWHELSPFFDFEVDIVVAGANGTAARKMSSTTAAVAASRAKRGSHVPVTQLSSEQRAAFERGGYHAVTVALPVQPHGTASATAASAASNSPRVELRRQRKPARVPVRVIVANTMLFQPDSYDELASPFVPSPFTDTEPESSAAAEAYYASVYGADALDPLPEEKRGPTPEQRRWIDARKQALRAMALQWQWLEKEFSSARAAGLDVIFVSHVPPGAKSGIDPLQEQHLFSVLARYADITLASLYGDLSRNEVRAMPVRLRPLPSENPSGAAVPPAGAAAVGTTVPVCALVAAGGSPRKGGGLAIRRFDFAPRPPGGSAAAILLGGRGRTSSSGGSSSSSSSSGNGAVGGRVAGSSGPIRRLVLRDWEDWALPLSSEHAHVAPELWGNSGAEALWVKTFSFAQQTGLPDASCPNIARYAAALIGDYTAPLPDDLAASVGPAAAALAAVADVSAGGAYSGAEAQLGLSPRAAGAALMLETATEAMQRERIAAETLSALSDTLYDAAQIEAAAAHLASPAAAAARRLQRAYAASWTPFAAPVRAFAPRHRCALMAAGNAEYAACKRAFKKLRKGVKRRAKSLRKLDKAYAKLTHAMSELDEAEAEHDDDLDDFEP